MTGELLVCVDLSPSSVQVLAAADKVAGAFGVVLHVLHVAAGEPEFMGYDPPGGAFDRTDHAHEVEAARAQLDELVEAAALQATVERLVVAGPTVDAVHEIADALDVALIVVGRGAHGRVLERLLGSVATELVRRATRPTLVVPIGG